MNKLKDTKFIKAVSKVWNNKFFSIPWIRLGLLAILLNFIIECLSRHSFVKGIIYFGHHPLAFLFNCVMIFFTLSFAMLFKKRMFFTFLISAIWLGFGITNFIIRSSRKTPFTAPDFLNISDGLKIIKRYFSTFKIVLVIVLVALVLGFIVFLAIKSPKIKGKINYLVTTLIIAVTFGVIMLSNYIANRTGLIPTSFGNIVMAYDTYGFGYVFSCSLFRSGISKPKNYSPEKVDDLVHDVDDKIDDNKKEPDEEKPNIIFLQLESFFDSTLVEKLEFSEDPIPTMHELYKKYPSGYLSVPSFGAGTANTEFETITGMNLDDFGPGEYPYKTVLRNNPCESICYYLTKYNYICTALHDNEGDFYTRNTVFSRLGFDQFVSLEYFDRYDTNPIGWPKDECMIAEITGILDSTKNQDFIYAISVQGHGDYPTDTKDMDLPIKVSNNNLTGNANGFEYYVNQTHEMDKFVADLIAELEKRDEKTVLVMYGDHLPTFDFTDDMLVNKDIYQTQYVVWNNFDLKLDNRDLQSYQLASYVMNSLDMVGGVISKLHIASMDSDDKSEYLANLKLLEYDILYGDCEAYEGINPFRITNMRMGYKPIKILNAENVYSHIVLRGRNFTEYSMVVINGTEYQTIFNGPYEIWVDGYKLKDGDEICVAQISVNGNELSRTGIYTYKE